MIRRLIIHSGMPRAGSSTIQEALYRQRKKLEGAGLFYAALDLKHSSDGKAGQVYNHRQLCEAGKGLWTSRRFHELHGEIADAIRTSEAKDAVLSYEGWWDPRNHRSLRRTLRFLRARLPEFAVTIGAVMRDPLDFLLSLYKLDVLHGRTKEAFESYWPAKLNEPRLRYADIADAFGKLADETRFIRFEDATTDGRLAGNVLDAFGIDSIFQRAGAAHLGRHRSPGGVYFSDAVITMMRFAAGELGLPHIARNRTALMQLMHELSQRSDLRSECERLIIPMSGNAVASITAATQQQASDFCRRYLKMEMPVPPLGDDRAQSTIDRQSALGRAVLEQLPKP